MHDVQYDRRFAIGELSTYEMARISLEGQTEPENTCQNRQLTDQLSHLVMIVEEKVYIASSPVPKVGASKSSSSA